MKMESKSIQEELEIRIGCTGWSYPAWQGTFYPKGLKENILLKHYSKIFNVTEVNSSYYHVPTKFVARKWYSETPQDFRFSLKIPGIITHENKLDFITSREVLTRFFSNLEPLKSKILVLVFQLPPSLNFDTAESRLDVLSEHLPHNYRYAIEGRNNSWFSDEAISFLSEKKFSLVWSEIPMVDNPAPVTTDFVYLRIIGDRDLPDDAYPRKVRDKRDVLQKWANKLEGIKSNSKVKFALAFTNNHLEGFAPSSANTLRKLCGLPELDWKGTQQKTIFDY